MITTQFGDFIAERMCAEHRVLARRWFERLIDLLPVEARDVFPSKTLLDHVPGLIREVGRYLLHPEADAVAANTAMLEKARELGALRHSQQASLHQVVREYHLLNGVLVAFVLEEMDRMSVLPRAPECVALVSRLHQAVDVLSQATIESFVEHYTKTIHDQNERLEQFTRMASHEWRQPLGALRVGVTLLGQPDVDRGRFARALASVERTVEHLIELTRKLESIARMREAADDIVLQEISSGTLAHEAVRQLREMAEARGVEIHIAADLPTLTIDVGRLELIFVNLLSNAIKYSDPSKTARRVEVSGSVDADGWCHIEVRDNGIGIPDGALDTIFQRFTRAHTEREDLGHIDGVGLGLSIVEDSVRAVGGRIDLRSAEGVGTAFTVTLPVKPAV
jgi:signal transduction histidine kinase